LCYDCKKPLVWAPRAVPQRDDDKGWLELEKAAERYRRAYRGIPTEAQPAGFNFGIHLRAKRGTFAAAPPEKPPKTAKPCAKRRCYYERPCPACRIRLKLEAVERMLTEE
jgi:hypothetical protein